MIPEQTISESRLAIELGPAVLAADLLRPHDARALVVFAHGTGSGRRSPRNRHVANELVHADMACLLLDLLTEEEQVEDERTGVPRFDISLLGTRVVQCIDWLGSESAGSLPIGLYGASTGAAAAIVAAAQRPDRIGAVVSRGGRPDLAYLDLERLDAPTLLIVGGADELVLELNRSALRRMRCEKHIEVVPGAGHLFEEHGTLEAASSLARAWFVRHLLPARPL